MKYIEERIKNHQDVFSDTKLKKVEIDETYPEYLRENLQKFKEFII